MQIPVAEWLPDLPPFNNPGATVATNVLPGLNCYEPMPSLQVFAQGATGNILGAGIARDNANNQYVYAGDVSALYVQTGGSLNAVTRVTSGGPYTVDINDNAWEFVQWNQTVIAVDGMNDRPQQISLGAAAFVNLSAAPAARHIAVINNFVVLGNISDSATQVQRVRWSAINNSGSWTQDPTTLADLQDLPGDGGWVQKIIGGEQGGYVFQERKIWAMNFVGSPLIFQFNPVIQNNGALCAEGVINYENLIYFIGQDGFYSFDGSNLQPIGSGKVDKTFFNDLDTNHIKNIRAAIWPQKKIVMWSYPSSNNIGGRCDRIMIYSWAYQRWSRIEIPPAYSGGIDHLFFTVTSGYTIDNIDGFGTLDTLPFSLDDRAWTGGNLVLGAFINTGLYYFSGTTSMSAEVETAEINPMVQLPMTALQQAPNDANRMLSTVNEIWPLVDGASNAASADDVQITIGLRNLQSDPVSYGMAQSPIQSAGFVQSRTTGRFFRFRISTDGNTNFNFIQGVDIRFVPAGIR